MERAPPGNKGKDQHLEHDPHPHQEEEEGRRPTVRERDEPPAWQPGRDSHAVAQRRHAADQARNARQRTKGDRHDLLPTGGYGSVRGQVLRRLDVQKTLPDRNRQSDGGRGRHGRPDRGPFATDGLGGRFGLPDGGGHRRVQGQVLGRKNSSVGPGGQGADAGDDSQAASAAGRRGCLCGRKKTQFC